MEVIRRLSKYRNVMQQMKQLGLVKVFSDNLADAIGVSSSLVRKDFSMFNLTGNKRGGYRIDDLMDKLNKMLGKDQEQQIIIIGCGKLGQALINHNAFTRVGIQVAAGFDTDVELVDAEAPIPILHAKKMVSFIEEHQIRVAALAVPEPAAQVMVDMLKKTSVKGVINFAPIPIKSDEGFMVHNINIELEIENLFYNIHFAESHSPAINS
jgi:redox-sensing transcriptional repressor